MCYLKHNYKYIFMFVSIVVIDYIEDDIIGGKGKYSIPYLLENNYKIIIHEYQVLMIKK